MIRRLRRILFFIIAALLGLTLLVFLSGTLVFRGSLPRLEGDAGLPGLIQSVTVSRDALGVPDITAHNRVDAARALGYVHAQERFFQMDLQRRNASGELAAMLGSALVPSDRDTRIHQFQQRAELVVQGLSVRDRAILDAYTAGVNSGLQDLKVRPFEYLLLRQKPQPWRNTDTVLCLYAMCLDLSFWTAHTEEAWALVRDTLPAPLVEFLLPRSNPWEAPLQTDPIAGISIPDSSELDTRQWIFNDTNFQQFSDDTEPIPHQDTAGSNSWAVAGNLSGHGGAILANDMHLGHGLPNIWYRVRMSWVENDSSFSVVGVTLPGAPAMVVGSNGKLAWGFTNSYGDWVDLVILETDPADSSRYQTPDGWQHRERRLEIIEVAGAEPDSLWIDGTIWGPVWTRDIQGRPMALRWTAHDPQTVNLNLMHLENTPDVDTAVALASSIGIPQQNLVCADDQGRIAWTIVGSIPKRIGWDGRLPVSWADGSCRWEGYGSSSAQPRMIDPSDGLLWTANNRVASGNDLDTIGDGGYALGFRARQIRDDLRALDRPLEKDLLGVQLDDRAVFLEQWRLMVLEILDRDQPPEESPRVDFHRIVRDDWSGRAEISSVSYPLVREFVYKCIDQVYALLVGPCIARDPDFRSREMPHRHAITWALLTERPDHLLPPWANSWDEIILTAVDKTMESRTSEDETFNHRTWAEINTVQVAHPFVHLAPWLSRWLAAPRQPMSGDSLMPRVQHRSSGASERMVVSPGRESEGIFHMPGGQSGHPLSPFFLAGHEAWVEGLATPLLPGPEEYRLVLYPTDDEQ